MTGENEVQRIHEDSKRLRKGKVNINIYALIVNFVKDTRKLKIQKFIIVIIIHHTLMQNWKVYFAFS